MAVAIRLARDVSKAAPDLLDRFSSVRDRLSALRDRSMERRIYMVCRSAQVSGLRGRIGRT
jgi:hypothetical protein